MVSSSSKRSVRFSPRCTVRRFLWSITRARKALRSRAYASRDIRLSRLITCDRSISKRVQGFLETIGMAALRLGERLEPVGDLAEAFVARLLRHAGIHVGVLVGLARHRRLQVVARAPDRQVGGRIADRLQVLEVAVRVSGLAFGGRAEKRGYVVLAFDVGLRGEVQVAAIRLRFTGERGLQVVVGLGTFERFHGISFKYARYEASCG